MSDTTAALIELRRAWIASGLAHQEIARRTGINRTSVTRALNGKHISTLETFTRLADALGYDLALIPREDTP